MRGRQRWMTIAVVVVGLMTLAYANINFYFYRYYADPESLKNERYKSRAEIVRGADGSKPVHGFAWPSLPSCSRGYSRRILMTQRRRGILYRGKNTSRCATRFRSSR